MKADRYNKGKPQWSLVYFPALVWLIDVLEYGCFKYSPNQWKLGLNREEILESMQRHLTALFEGEEFDSDSKAKPTHHIGHIMANCMFYAFMYIHDKFLPERVTPYGEQFKPNENG